MRRMWTARSRAPREDERGSLAPLLPVVAMALLMLAGLGIDGSRQLNARGQAVAFAEEAARAGATQVDPDAVQIEVDPAKARAAVANYCARVKSLGQVTECRLVSIDPISGSDRRRNIVRTTVSTRIDTTLLSMVGIRSLSSGATAKAQPFEGFRHGIE